jgi:phenylalanyl-tRNA synthetase beta chain
MRVSLNWLKDYVNLTLPPQELADRLTMAGTEVDRIQALGGQWDNISVGQIVAIDPHPNADRLRLATIDLGVERHTVVCGAPNIEVGQRVPFARVGAELIDGHTGQTVKLKAATIRGIVSEGMACSEKELGLSDSHEGILVLPPDAPLGMPLAQYLGDTILDLSVTPNRPDCLSVLGIAREAAALTGQPLTPPQEDYPEKDAPIEEMAAVDIIDPDLCPRYCASLISGIKVAPSPRWLQDRLTACGMRPINNIVDVTNYVMLEYGQPLHAFDFATIRGRKIVVRRARQDESIITLDGSERALSRDMLVIADTERAVAIAGVMGGEETEVTPGTTSILLESANFNPSNNRLTASGLRLRTEASLRFEKGLNPDLPEPALRRATRLILELAGGKAARGILDAYPGRTSHPPIPLSAQEVERVLGLKVELDEIKAVLGSLGFDLKEGEHPAELLVQVPYWRSDITLPADLVEEVARIIGYERIPTRLRCGDLPLQPPDPLLAFRERLRDILTGCGLEEVINYSLTSLEKLRKAMVPPEPHPLELANPLSLEQNCLRTSLRPGLLSTVAQNQKHQDTIRVFEMGRVYLAREEELPQEQEQLAIVLSGHRGEQFWKERETELDFFDAKGLAESLFRRLELEPVFQPSQDPGLHPAQQADMLIDGIRMGTVGQVHPRVAEAFDLSENTYLIELEPAHILPLTLAPHQYRPLPRFPGIVRDIALVVDQEVAAQKLQQIIQGSPLVSQVSLFDVYTGPQVSSGKKSLAYRIVFQSPARTLTDDEVDRAQQKILDRLRRELGAFLRG